MRALRTGTILAGTLVLGALTAAPAMATSVTWTLGTDSYTGNSNSAMNCSGSCNSDSIGYGQATFNSDTGGVPLILSAFSSQSYGGYGNYNAGPIGGPYASELTQKSGSVAESGVGATNEVLNNPDGEIQANEAVLVDASHIGNGYSLTNLSIGSVQKGEGFTIYNLSQSQATAFTNAMSGTGGSAVLPLSGNTAAGWAVIASFTNTSGCSTNSGNCAVENVNLGNAANPYFLITDAALNCGNGDILLTSAGASQNSHSQPPGGNSVPEPASLGLLVVGLAGLGFARRYRRTPA